MISVNQGIGASVPEKLENGGRDMMFHIKGGPLNRRVEKFNGEGGWYHVGHHAPELGIQRPNHYTIVP